MIHIHHLMVALFSISSACCIAAAQPSLCTQPFNTPATTSAIQCMDLSIGFKLCSVSDSNYTAFRISCSQPVEIGGSCAFGFGKRMIGSTAVVGWKYFTADQPQMQQFFLSGQSPFAVLPIPDTHKNSLNLCYSNISFAGNVITMEFTRPNKLISAEHNIEQGKVDVVYAVSGVPTRGSPVNLIEHSFNGRASGQLDFINRIYTSAGQSIYNYRTAHATLMTTAFGLIFPVAIYWAAFGKEIGPWWFYFHQVFNLLGFALVLCGAVIGYWQIGTEAYMTHYTIGTTIICSLVFQLLNAAIRPAAPKEHCSPTLKRKVWKFIHHVNGRCGYVLGIVQIFIGFNLPSFSDRSRNYMYLFAALWVCVLLLGGSLFLRQRCRKYSRDTLCAINKAEKSKSNFSNIVAK
jgi:hypothetical protein